MSQHRSGESMTNPVVAVFRFLGFILWTLLLIGPYLILLARGWKGCARYARFYFKGVTWICGLQVVARGVPVVAQRPALFVCNHVSYLDILVLGSLLDACFVAKAEVADWPGFGFLSKIARTAFVNRSRNASARERDQLRGRLDQGDALILFPEGTSNDGNRVLPFKSALLSVAEGMTIADGSPLPIQPVSIAYSRLDGVPLGRALRPFYAWYGDMTLAGHLFAALGLGLVTVEVVFHPVVTLADFANRKALTNHCHDRVNRGVINTLCGRLDRLDMSPHQAASSPAKLDS